MSQIDSLVTTREPGKDMILPYGPFANKLIANYVGLKDDIQLMLMLTDKISKIMPNKFNIISLNRVKLFFPWDIHSDYYKNECSSGHEPYYNFIIPLDDFNSRTVIFDQTTNDDPTFMHYKTKNQPVDNPISETFWNENLSMCWPHDRPYVSLRECLPLQRRGQLLGFPSKYFHSSDNFHTKFSKPKLFIQLRTEYNPNA
jgi:hypothetical protein